MYHTKVLLLLLLSLSLVLGNLEKIHFTIPISFQVLQHTFIEVSSCMPTLPEFSVLIIQVALLNGNFADLPFKYTSGGRNGQTIQGSDFESMGQFLLTEPSAYHGYFRLFVKNGVINVVSDLPTTVQPVPADLFSCTIPIYRPEEEPTGEVLRIDYVSGNQIKDTIKSTISKLNADLANKGTLPPGLGILMEYSSYNTFRMFYNPKNGQLSSSGAMLMGRLNQAQYITPQGQQSHFTIPNLIVRRGLRYDSKRDILTTSNYKKEVQPILYIRNSPFCNTLVGNQENRLKVRTYVKEMKLTSSLFYDYIYDVLPSCRTDSERHAGRIQFPGKVRYTVTCHVGHPGQYIVQGAIAYNGRSYKCGLLKDDGTLYYEDLNGQERHRPCGSGSHTVHLPEDWSEEITLLSNTETEFGDTEQQEAKLKVDKQIDVVSLPEMRQALKEANMFLLQEVCTSEENEQSSLRLEVRGMKAAMSCGYSSFVSDFADEIDTENVIRISEDNVLYESRPPPRVLYHQNADVFTANDRDIDKPLFGWKVKKDFTGEDGRFSVPANPEKNIILNLILKALLTKESFEDKGVIRFDKNKMLVSAEVVKKYDMVCVRLSGEFQLEPDTGFQDMNPLVYKDPQTNTLRYISYMYPGSLPTKGLDKDHFQVKLSPYKPDSRFKRTMHCATLETLEEIFTRFIKENMSKYCHKSDGEYDINVVFSSLSFVKGSLLCSFNAIRLVLPIQTAITIHGQKLRGAGQFTAVYKVDTKYYQPHNIRNDIFAFIIKLTKAEEAEKLLSENPECVKIADGTKYKVHVVPPQKVDRNNNK